MGRSRRRSSRNRRHRARRGAKQGEQGLLSPASSSASTVRNSEWGGYQPDPYSSSGSNSNSSPSPTEQHGRMACRSYHEERGEGSCPSTSTDESNFWEGFSSGGASPAQEAAGWGEVASRASAPPVRFGGTNKSMELKALLTMCAVPGLERCFGVNEALKGHPVPSGARCVHLEDIERGFGVNEALNGHLVPSGARCVYVEDIERGFGVNEALNGHPVPSGARCVYLEDIERDFGVIHAPKGHLLPSEEGCVYLENIESGLDINMERACDFNAAGLAREGVQGTHAPLTTTEERVPKQLALQPSAVRRDVPASAPSIGGEVGGDGSSCDNVRRLPPGLEQTVRPWDGGAAFPLFPLEFKFSSVMWSQPESPCRSIRSGSSQVLPLFPMESCGESAAGAGPASSGALSASTTFGGRGDSIIASSEPQDDRRFLLDLARMNPVVVSLGEQLGEGGFGKVHTLLMKDTTHQQVVDACTDGAGLVVKIPKGSSPVERYIQERELRNMERIQQGGHKNLIKIVSLSFETGTIVMGAAICDIETMLKQKTVLSSMSLAERMRMMAGVARGLEYLSSTLGLVHGDIKPANILVTEKLDVKVTDFGLSDFLQDPVTGLTPNFAAPEAVASFQREEISNKATMQPSLDTYSLGVVMIQMLFIEQESRFQGNALAQHGLTPIDQSFATAFDNVEKQNDVFRATGTVQDRRRLEELAAVVLELHETYAAQLARMGNLRETILDQNRWKQPGTPQLHFHEEVTLVLLSLLNKNPHRRVGLATAASLLECPVLWSAAASDGGFASDGDSTGAEWRGDAYAAPHLPPDVRGIIEHTIRDYLLVNPALDTASGAWWEAPQFDSPWWEYPPTVEPISFEG